MLKLSNKMLKDTFAVQQWQIEERILERFCSRPIMMDEKYTFNV